MAGAKEETVDDGGGQGGDRRWWRGPKNGWLMWSYIIYNVYSMSVFWWQMYSISGSESRHKPCQALFLKQKFLFLLGQCRVHMHVALEFTILLVYITPFHVFQLKLNEPFKGSLKKHALFSFLAKIAFSWAWILYMQNSNKRKCPQPFMYNVLYSTVFN